MTSVPDPRVGWRDAETNADFTLELPAGGGPMFFRAIPPGQFVMGSRAAFSDEEPRNVVAFSQPFWMATFPVTQRQFRAFSMSGGSENSSQYGGHDELPATEMKWEQAKKFCEWLNGLEDQLECRVADLPTEAEWEYACRAGTTTEYWSGDGEAALRDVAWFDANSGGRVHIVGELGTSACNPWGLYDVHGNVWEWCLDVYDRDAYRKRNDAEDGSLLARKNEGESQAIRVVRGGSWFNPARLCRSAYRDWGWPVNRGRFLGFRVCLLRGPVVFNKQVVAEPQAEAKARGGERARGGTTRVEPSTRAEAARTS